MSRGRTGLVFWVLVLLLGLGTGLRAQQEPQQSLNDKYKAALTLYDQGDLQQAKKLLLEIKDTVKAGDIKLAPETAKAIDDKLADIDKKLGAAPAAAPAETAAAVEAPAAAPVVKPNPEADRHFEELRANPELVKEMNRREAQAARVRSMPTTMEGDQAQFEQARRDEEIRRQKTEEEIRAKLVEGLTLLGAYRFDEADKKFLAAQDQARYSDFSDEWKRTWLARVQEHVDLAARQKKEYLDNLRVVQQEKGTAELEQHLQEMRDRRDRQMARLMEQWEIFYDRQQYDDCMLVLKQAELINPTDPQIEKKRDLTRRKKVEVENVKLNMQRAFETTQQFNANDERMIPWFPVYKLPDNWKELSDKRLRATAAREERETPENRKVRQQLEDTVVSFTFADQPVKEALDFLQNLGSVNIVLDASKLADPNQTITLKLSNVSLENAIRLVAEQMKMKWVIRNGYVFISDEEGVKLTPETVVYDVWDLMATVPEFQGPEFQLSALQQSSGRGGSGGGGGGGIWGGGAAGTTGGGTSTTTEQAETPEQSLNNLIDLVKSVVAAGTWEEGSGNAIRGRSGSIIVTNTPEVLRKVQQLLADLRKARAIQVMVDIRFVTVTDTFLEDIGFDWGNATTPGFVFQNDLPKWNISGSLINALATTNGVATPAMTGTGGLNLSSAFLDDVTVNLFLSAVQRSFRNNVMQAPRLTMINGQRAYVAVSQQINYVSDVTVQVAEAAVGYEPTVSTIQDGVVFDVRPTVSADRRYVQLELRPAIARVIAIDNFPVVQGFNAVNIQLPRLQVTTVRASVSVPDGGTLLVGGLSYGFDADAEAGVPILSKIPVVGKLFTHRQMDQEKQVLLILVRPTIIIQEEYEAAVQ